MSICSVPEGSREHIVLASCSSDGKVMTWGLKEYKFDIKIDNSGQHNLKVIACVIDGRTRIAVCAGTKIHLWTIGEGEPTAWTVGDYCFAAKCCVTQCCCIKISNHADNLSLNI
jgi:hypothetical protein